MRKSRIVQLFNAQLYPVILSSCIGIILIISSLWYITNKNLEIAKQQIEQQIQMIESQQSIIQQQRQTIKAQEENINNLQNIIQQQTQQMEELQNKITNLQSQVESLTYQLQQTQGELKETTTELQETQRLLNIAKKYEERVERGIYLSKAYKLLGDYDKTINIVKNITTIGTPQTDEEIWERAKDIYNWLGENYQYCSDKGFCIDEDYCTQIQFFSPDELLYYSSQDVLCGDCDDQAHLFAGMMYASGVPHNKVRVECGNVEAGSHCWNAVYVNGGWYRIDPVCSNPAKYVEFFGIKILISGKEFPNTYKNVDCFSSYELMVWYTPEEYHTIS